MKNQIRIGEILIKKKYITKKQLDNALNEKSSKPTGQVLIEMGFVTENEINEALTEQTLAQKAQEKIHDAVTNPIQHKLLWFIVIFAIIGIVTIYTIVTGRVGDDIIANKEKNKVQAEYINANTVKQKKLRLRYVGHSSKLKEIEDSTFRIKDRASNFKKDTDSEIKRIDSDMYYTSNILNDQDSIITEELSDLNDRFFSYRNKSKISISSLEKMNNLLRTRIDGLESKLIDLEKKLNDKKK